jgi:tetratricopeptide (TPR) repeat protein
MLRMPRRLPVLVAICLSGLVLAPAARADVIHLKDGSQLEGDITKTPEGWTVRDAAGKVTTVPADRVKSLEAKRETGPDAATQRLASLRRSAEGMDDPKKVIDRYTAFIKQYPETPAAQEAKNDLKAWEDRQAQGMTKVGDKWVTAAERQAIRQDALTDLTTARDLLVEGRTRDAAPAIEKALAKDPQNPAAHYLKGLVLAKQDQLVPARKEFEAVLSSAPDHAPTLNNLGVILFLTKQAPASLNYYDLAMQAAPGTRRILDNVAEALHGLPEEHRAAAPVKKAVKHFNEQDNMLQGRMAQQNNNSMSKT